MLDSLPRGNLVVSPDIGIDVGVTKVKGKYLVSSSDPITGTNVRIGWYAVNVSANDVATSGIMPDVLNVVALFPSKTTAITIQRVMSEINRTASDLWNHSRRRTHRNHSFFEKAHYYGDRDRLWKKFRNSC